MMTRSGWSRMRLPLRGEVEKEEEIEFSESIWWICNLYAVEEGVD